MCFRLGSTSGVPNSVVKCAPAVFANSKHLWNCSYDANETGSGKLLKQHDLTKMRGWDCHAATATLCT